MHQLPTLLLKEFLRGNFVVKRSSAKFNQVSLDQAQEWLYATGKKGGGIVSITKTPSAFSRRALSYYLRAHFAAQTLAMFDIHNDDRLTHKENGEERQKQDNGAENALHSTVRKFGVFSSQTNGTLQNIATKDLATPEIEQSLVQARSLGQSQLENFVERRLLSSDREEEERELEEGAEENVRDTIRKNNPPTFASLYEVKSVATGSEKRTILRVDRSVLCCLVTAYEARREVNMKATLQHELMHAGATVSRRNGTHHANGKQA